MRRARILIARRHVHNGLRVAASHLSVEFVSQMDDLVDAMAHRKPAVLLLPIDFPGLEGPHALRGIVRLGRGTKVVVLSPSVNEEEELEVLRMGARGYSGPVEGEVLLKMIDKVQEGELWAGRRAIGALHDESYGPDSADRAPRGPTRRDLETLTSREREILRLLADGATNKEIATALNVTVSTVKAHLTSMFRKLDQPGRLHLALYAARATAFAPLGPPNTK
jgi:DNA-binding NarL/FixJ family response regulator